MAWSTPRIWAAAELVTAANMNTYISDDLSALRAGGIAIASQATGDFVYASSSTQLARLAVGAAYTSIRRNAAGSAYEFFRPEQKRVSVSSTSNTTPTPNASTDDVYDATSMTVNMTWGAPTGTPTQGQRLLLRIHGTAPRTLTWNGAYRPAGPALPTTTGTLKFLHLLFVYNGYYTTWDLVGAAQEA
jgi:hypothetical protein